MAFNLGDDEDSLMADINVTPLVDVMLVLLIIFMVAAPMLHQGIEVKLPQAATEKLPMNTENPLVLSVNADGLIYILDTPVHPTQLVERLLPLLENRGDQSVFLKGDESVPYGSVIEVLDLLHEGGVRQVNLVTRGKTRKETAGGNAGRGGSR